jgi:hypothetical protein
MHYKYRVLVVVTDNSITITKTPQTQHILFILKLYT